MPFFGTGGLESGPVLLLDNLSGPFLFKHKSPMQFALFVGAEVFRFERFTAVSAVGSAVFFPAKDESLFLALGCAR